mmetsp:Transcript_12142/g.48839  ORF Transcript_12142/g.48839 Transcript_12142/m.48839 type:complete len:89 (+) Transcript_12142:55-321(+)|eukprot:CAMPEP_0114604430 /NCGR_PEP_ID=MMETSP0168-20121206/540_1 /TAXON_ID=95228 ORGANISM="Vannella sp., Strain DIVA3 517/6/12" /NCGR_SAMPLE_ID=MMETSP0168 /ASSEMBLY_ACC=CAM_ASM_000044 /LENGTH=88 /DNA_ID=CAMNT_0001815259 /DNA_START=55 /DNA_END=321 /DNA_ORIENTATION=+
MADLMAEISKGTELKAAETVDKSAPIIEEGVSVKKVDRSGFLNEVSAGKDLKPAETVDKSAPVIEDGVKIQESKRPALLAEIKKAAAE